MIKRLLLLFVAFSTFVSWFAISSWLRLPVTLILIIAVLSVPFLILQTFKRPLGLIVEKEDLFLIGLVVMVWISFTLGYKAPRAFNHSLSYTFSIFVYLLFFKLVYYRNRLTIPEVCGAITVCLFMSDFIVILEWVSINYFYYPIREFFITGGEGTSNMAFYTQKFFYSVAGVTEEPGHSAYFVNVYFPFAIYYLKEIRKDTLLLYITISLHLLALIFLASAGGWVFLFISFALFNLPEITKIIRKYYWVLAIPVAVLALSTTFKPFREYFNLYYDYVKEKTTLSDENASSKERKIKIASAFDEWYDTPLFGKGPGYGVETYETGYFNTYVTILSDIGLIAFLFALIFGFFILKRYLLLDPILKYYFGISICYLLLHSSICVLYYHFPFWLPILMVQLAYRERHNTLESTTYLMYPEKGPLDRLSL